MRRSDLDWLARAMGYVVIGFVYLAVTVWILGEIARELGVLIVGAYLLGGWIGELL